MREKRTGGKVGETESLPEDLEAGGLVDESTGDPADRPARGQREKKRKVTYSLPEALVRMIAVVAGELGIDPCELVARLLWPALKGCRKPTIPHELRTMFPPNGKSAA